MINKINAILDKKKIQFSLFVISTLFRACYGTTSFPSNSGFELQPQQKSIIESLSTTQKQIPAWAILALLDISDRLNQNSFPLTSVQPITLNEFLADSGSFKAKLISIKCAFVEATDVRKELQLLPPDESWSVMLLDLKYVKPVQLFTTQRPVKFKKNQSVLAIGVVLGSRVDQPKNVNSSKPFVIPVLVGVLKPLDQENSLTKEYETRKTLHYLIMGIVVLVAFYIILKVHVSRNGRKRIEHLAYQKSLCHSRESGNPGSGSSGQAG